MPGTRSARRPRERPDTTAIAIHNPDVAAILDEIADLLELGEANPFRVRAYRNAAGTGYMARCPSCGRSVRWRSWSGPAKGRPAIC